MKILHTADLHLGQVIYQNYDRSDEHRHFFDQLKKWCKQYQPDALVVSGDVFDIQQPSATTKKAFTEQFVEVHKAYPNMRIIVTAGNHDSASRLHADSAVWSFANTTVIGLAPNILPQEGWEERYIVRLDSGYIIALPYMSSERTADLQHLLDVVAKENTDGKPVVMTGHTAVTGLDILGHDFDIGTLKTQNVASLGEGYDYLALGHIHKPQTIGHMEDTMQENVTYQAPVIRYSGSALHVSCDEAYPHSVSLVEIDKHNGQVNIKQLRIDELRHFYVLPKGEGAYTSAQDAISDIQDFCKKCKSGYIRLRVQADTNLPSNFNQMVYDILSTTGDEVRYNPKTIWTGAKEEEESKNKRPTFEVAELQQMENPFTFIEKTIDQYPSIDISELREAFTEIEEEVRSIEEAETEKERIKASKKTSNQANTNEEEEKL